MKRFAGLQFVLILIVGFSFVDSSAQPQELQHFPGTGHWYQAVAATPALCWTQCRDSALALGGYLATITSAEENSFILSLNAPDVETYIGGYEPNNDGVWVWVTGESWEQFVNWDQTVIEPNNTGDYLGMYTPSAVPSTRPGKWNDTYDCALRESFIVEYDDACPLNQPPLLDSVHTDTVLEASTISMRVCAADPDIGDSIVLEIVNPLPNSVFIDSGNGCGSFTFNPDTTQAGSYVFLFTATDSCSAEDSVTMQLVVLPCDAIPGDANKDATLTLSDVISVVNLIFNKPGCAPAPMCWVYNLLCRGDWNADEIVSLADAIRGVNYLFVRPGGPWDPIPSDVCCLPVP